MQTLLTKNGHRTGNAIIICEVFPSSSSMKDYLKKTSQRLWLIETDYGNRVRLTDRELGQQFYRGELMSYEKWKADRHNLHRSNEIDDEVRKHP